MSDETVEVTVRLPKPPEGWEYTGEYSPALHGFQFAKGALSREPNMLLGPTSFVYRRVAPPERMITLTLPEKAVRFLTELHDQTAFAGPLIDGIQEAARAALAQEQEVCGEPVCTHRIAGPGDYRGVDGPCALPKGHGGEHRPAAV